MELPPRDEVPSWLGLPVLDARGNALGTCEQLYVDESTGTPEWAVVGLDDGRSAFVPLVDATAQDGSVHVTFDQALVASAPSFPDSGRLTPEQDMVLYRHYGVPYSTEESATVLPTDEPEVSEPDVPVQAAAPVRADLPVQPDVASEPDVTVLPAAAGRLRPLDFGPPEDSTTDVEPEPVRPAPPVAAPFPVTPSRGVRPTVPAPVPAAPAPWSGAEPAVLGGLAIAVALFGLRRALPSRRTTPAQRASRQLQAATTTASRAARAQSLAALRAALQAEAAAARALAKAAQEGGRATRTGAVRSRQIARAGAVAGRRLAGTGAARGQELTRAAALRRQALAQTAAARSSELAKAAAGLREEAAKAGAARRRQAAKDVAARRRKRAATSVVGGSSTRTVSRATSRDRRTGGAAVAAPVRVARRGALRLLVDTAHGGQRLRRSWRRNTRRLALGLGLAGGYVMGARAGEQRYEEIVQRARLLRDQPQVQSLRDRLPASLGGSHRAR